MLAASSPRSEQDCPGYEQRLAEVRFGPHYGLGSDRAPCLKSARTGSRQCQLIGGNELRGTVELVAPGSLPNDGKVIADERPVA
jgi:hypothetical protein